MSVYASRSEGVLYGIVVSYVFVKNNTSNVALPFPETVQKTQLITHQSGTFPNHILKIAKKTSLKLFPTTLHHP